VLVHKRLEGCKFVWPGICGVLVDQQHPSDATAIMALGFDKVVTLPSSMSH
jgi:hypothetical protein